MHPATLTPKVACKNPCPKAIRELESFEHALPVLLTWCLGNKRCTFFHHNPMSVDLLCCVMGEWTRVQFGDSKLNLTCRLYVACQLLFCSIGRSASQALKWVCRLIVSTAMGKGICFLLVCYIYLLFWKLKFPCTLNFKNFNFPALNFSLYSYLWSCFLSPQAEYPFVRLTLGLFLLIPSPPILLLDSCFINHLFLSNAFFLLATNLPYFLEQKRTFIQPCTPLKLLFIAFIL